MRKIEIGADVFSKIWAQRLPGEDDEDAILSRLLGIARKATASPAEEKRNVLDPAGSKILWRDDVKRALQTLGGTAHLSKIYEEVRSIRRINGRTVPKNLEAVVRRELEYNSSDATVYQEKRDWFRSVSGIGAGEWALRSAT